MKYFFRNFWLINHLYSGISDFYARDLKEKRDFSTILYAIYSSLKLLFIDAHSKGGEVQFREMYLFDTTISDDSNLLSISGVTAYIIYHKNNNIPDPFAAQSFTPLPSTTP